MKCLTEHEMGSLQSLPSSGSMRVCSLGPPLLAAPHIGLYNKVVTYFFLYRWVALSTITPSLIDSA